MIRSRSAGTSGLMRAAGAGLSRMTALRTSVLVRPWNGARPVTISYSTTPNAKRSLRASTRSPRACSGDM